jgi:hypothetical protein
MTKLCKRMIGDLKLCNLAETTIQTYTRVVRDFAGFFHRAPDKLDPRRSGSICYMRFRTRSWPGVAIRCIVPP